MKKIILGCAAVLLSLGLLAGCNNEESDKAVSIKVDTAATVVVGEDLALPYTVEPEKAKVEVFNDHEEYVTASADVGLISLTGVAAGNATITLVGTYKKYTEANVSIAVSVVPKGEVEQGPGEEEPGNTGDTEPGEQVITLSVDSKLDLIESGDTATIVPAVTPAEAEIEYEITDVVFADDTEPESGDVVISVTHTTEGYVVTPGLQGTANIVFTASLDGYDDVSATTAVTVHESGWEPLTEQTNYTLTVTFADPIPTYADAYITGYLAGGTSGTWVNYEIDSTGKMTVSEDRYSASYVFESVAVGNIAINVYFEYNNSAQYHDAATAATWAHNVFEGDATWAVISDDENVHETVLTVETDPSTIITDNNDFCELTIAIKNTNTSGFGEGFAPYFYHWVSDNPASAFVSMNQGACGEYTAATDYYFTVKTDGTTSDGNQTNYRISQGDEFKFQISVTEGSNQWHDAITIASGTTVPSEVEAYDSSRDIIIKGSGTSCESALVVFEFNFNACETKDGSGTNWTDPYNTLITNITYVSNWNAE